MTFQPDLLIDFPYARPSELPRIIDHHKRPRGERRLPLRALFRHEARLFTPFVASDLGPLSRTLGLPKLHLHGCRPEQHCASGWLDILGVIRSTRELVAIENQFGISDDDHVDRLRRYADDFEAGTSVLVCEETTRRHMNAASRQGFVIVVAALYRSRRVWGLHYRRAA